MATTPDNEELAAILGNREYRDLNDLRASLMKFGWIEQSPALLDEDGVVLNGNTRLALAAELGIEAVKQTVHLGHGDEADAKRLALSVGLNMGQNSLTQNDRRRIAEHLYKRKGWTMERIGEALNFSKQTISLDLSNCPTIGQLKPAKTDTNPKGAGRPKGSGRNAKPGPRPRPNQTDPVKDKIVAMSERGLPSREIAAEVGVNERAIRRALEIENAKKEAVEREKAQEIALSQSAQKRLEHAIARETKKLRAAFEQSIQAEIERRINEMVLPSFRKREAEYRLVLRARRGLLDKASYTKILRTLHPDFNTDPDKKPQCDEAFNLFRNLKKALLNESDDPTPASAIPATAAEMMELARKVREERARARQAKANSGTGASVH